MSERDAHEGERVEELAATSEDILEKVDRLRALEERRRRVKISTPEFHRLADEIEIVSHAIFRSAVQESTLAGTVETTDESLAEISEDRSN